MGYCHIIEIPVEHEIMVNGFISMVIIKYNYYAKSYIQITGYLDTMDQHPVYNSAMEESILPSTCRHAETADNSPFVVHLFKLLIYVSCGVQNPLSFAYFMPQSC